MIDRRTLLAATGAAATLAAFKARAQAFPNKAITLYCAFPAGGPTDQVFRALGEAAARELKQPVVVENRAGAGGTLAAIALKSARPDGYTLAQMPLGVFRIPHMQKSPQLDPTRDFSWVINLTGYTFGIVVPAGAPWKTFREFVDDARRNPEKINYGSTGTGTTPHLAVEEFAARAGIKLTHVPFKGSADLMAALLGGHIMAASDSTGWAPHVESGKLRLLVTFGSKRTRKWPEVPTLAELGFDTISDSPFGLAGPAGMDAGVVRVLHDAFRRALDDAKVRDLLERFDQPVIYMGPEEYARWARQTWESERGTIERLGLKGSM
jgi:tripartite-type tricarboxylate transporter receptor subunit TctC